jgi:hypothetical protein
MSTFNVRLASASPVPLLPLARKIDPQYLPVFSSRGTGTTFSPSGGDPANEYRTHSGGFKDQVRFYHSPRHIYQDSSLFPFTNPVFAGNPNSADLFPLDYMPNNTMTPENVAFMDNGFDGDFTGFQTYFEGGL